MITTGCIHDKRIELDEPLDLPNGTRVEVQIRPLLPQGSAALIGLCADEPELMDEILQDIMHQRETRPLRMMDDE